MASHISNHHKDHSGEFNLVNQLILAVSTSLLVSAFCSLCEAVLLSIPPSQVEVLNQTGRPSGRILKKLKSNIHRPITAILTLNTIANTAGATVCGALAAVIFGKDHLVLFSSLFTVTMLLFSEILPKTIGVSYSKTLAPLIALPINLIVTMLTPLIWVCQTFTRLLIPTRKEENQVAVEEILAITSMSFNSGQIDAQEERVIRNILSLKNRSVQQVMTPSTVTFSISGHLTLLQAWENRHSWSLHSRVPVYDNDPDDVVGIVLRKDLLLKLAEDQEQLHLIDIMQPVHFVPESTPLTGVLIDFIELHQHLFAVVDEYGTFTGVISLEDVIEEIVGREIMDESDKTSDMRELARKQRKKLEGIRR